MFGLVTVPTRLHLDGLLASVIRRATQSGLYPAEDSIILGQSVSGSLTKKGVPEKFTSLIISPYANNPSPARALLCCCPHCKGFSFGAVSGAFGSVV